MRRITLSLLLVVMILGGISTTSLTACATNAEAAPRLLWALQEGASTLRLDRLDLLYSAGLLRAVWEFAPRSDADVRFTIIVAAPSNPNWKQFEVRDGGALVNHLVRPEDDYLKTGGDPAMVSLGRSIASANLGEGYTATQKLFFVTFTYPSDLGVKRDPGPLTVSHVISPWQANGLEKRFVIGWRPPAGEARCAVSIRSDNPLLGIEARQSATPAGGQSILVRLYPKAWAVVATAAAAAALGLCGLWIRRRST